MEDKNKLGTIVDGIGASEHLDSSGEILDIKGMDISSLGSADSILNFEHGSKDNPAQVCGKVTFAKKIFKKSDCDNARQEHFWEICQKPFVYVKGELFDHPSLDHDGARNVAALLRYDNRDMGKKARRLISFSIEGGKMDKEGMVVKKSIARDLALTIKHCNKMCIAEILDDIKSRRDLYKNDTISSRGVIIEEMKKSLPSKQDFKASVDRYKDTKSFKQKQDISENITDAASKPIIKPEGSKSKREFSPKTAPSTMKVGDRIKYDKPKMKTGKDIYNDPNTWKSENNMRKALVAGMMGGSPGSQTGTAALAPEEIVGKMENVAKSKKKEKSETEDLNKGMMDTGKKIAAGAIIGTSLASSAASANSLDFHKFLSNTKKENQQYKSSVKGSHDEKGHGKGKYSFEVGPYLVTGTHATTSDGVAYHEPKILSTKNAQSQDQDGKHRQAAFDLHKKIKTEGKNRIYKEVNTPEKQKKDWGNYKQQQNPFSDVKNPFSKNESMAKMSQPNMSFPKMGIENRPDMTVKRLDPDKTFKNKAGKEFSQADIEKKKIENKYVQGQKKIAGADKFSDFDKKSQKYISQEKKGYGDGLDPKTTHGVNIVDNEFGINEAYDHSEGQSKEKMAQTKGKGNYPSTKHHEGLHQTLSSVAGKTSDSHSKNLVRHIMDNFFDKNNVKGVSDYVSQKYDSKDPHIREEHLTHVLDLLTNRDKRDDHNDHFVNGRVGDVDYKQLKQGWKKAVNFTKELDEKKLNEINDFYNKKDSQSRNKKVVVEKIPPGGYK